MLALALFIAVSVHATEPTVETTTVDAVSPCEPWVDRQGGVPRLRAHLDAFVPCVIDEPAYRRLIAEALRQADDANNDTLTVALGRIADYPWLSQTLADAALKDTGWNAQRGKPRSGSGNVNVFVQHLLLTDALRSRFAPPGWALGGVSVEKVLVMPLDGGTRAGKPRVPVDAQAWLRFQRDTPQP